MIDLPKYLAVATEEQIFGPYTSRKHADECAVKTRGKVVEYEAKAPRCGDGCRALITDGDYPRCQHHGGGLHVDPEHDFCSFHNPKHDA